MAAPFLHEFFFSRKIPRPYRLAHIVGRGILIVIIRDKGERFVYIHEAAPIIAFFFKMSVKGQVVIIIAYTRKYHRIPCLWTPVSHGLLPAPDHHTPHI